MKFWRSNILLFTIVIFMTCQVFAQLTVTNKITGIQDPSLKNAYSRLKLHQKITKGHVTKKDLEKYVDEGPGEIKKAIAPYGYFKTTVNARLSHKGNKWTINFHVNPGPQLKITELHIKLEGKGKYDHRLQRYFHHLPLDEGDGFDTDTYKKVESNLLELAQKRAYLKAKFTKNKIIINLKRYTCAILMTLDTGPKFYFGPVKFTKTPLNESFLRRYITFKYGSPYSYNSLLNMQQNLSGGGYFQSVSVVPQVDKAVNQHIPTRVNLTMNKKREYLFGLGYGTNTGMRGTFGYNMRWVNRYGHKFYFNTTLSAMEQNLAAQYTIPGKDPAHERYIITGGIYKQSPKHGDAVTRSVGVGYIRNYTKWQRTILLNYELETYRFERHESYQHSRLLMPSLLFTRTIAKDPIKVENGSKFTILLRGSSQHLASTVSFFQGDLQYKQIFTLTENNRFVMRGDLGYTLMHKRDRLPLSKNFYTGGIDTIRGYSYKGIGPGRYLAIASAEYQRRIKGNFYGAIFYDIGNAMDHMNEPLIRGTGVGVVWQSPVGALRIYIARALSDKHRPLRLEFSLGPDL